jgi:hypothetical protein
MIRRATLLLMTLSLLVCATTSASAASTPSKEYTFAELIFDSEVKRPSGEQFSVKGKADFGRLSYIARPSFMSTLLQSSSESVLGSSADRWSVLSSESVQAVRWALASSSCWARLSPRQ